MIGFDRPIRPEWIFKTLELAKPGQKLQDMKLPFEEIAWQLDGKEGKRKARTVLFRIFLREGRSVIVRDHIPLQPYIHEFNLEYLKPAFLFVMIGKTEVLMKINELLLRLYEFGDSIDPVLIKRKLIELHGERDVVSRSVGSYLTTLEHFQVLKKENNQYILSKPLKLDISQTSIFLQLYANEILQSPQIHVKHLPKNLFGLYNLPNIQLVIREYSGVLWTYQERMHDWVLIMKKEK